MPGRPQESVLIMVPTHSESAPTFPAPIVEGKAYSTGKQVFEAQNQAAVSEAGGLKIQVSLDELVKRATRDSEPSLMSQRKMGSHSSSSSAPKARSTSYGPTTLSSKTASASLEWCSWMFATGCCWSMPRSPLSGLITC